jgi:lysylphosphatidylglycerol synthetase-like protein (DUF2156 family)
MGWLVWFVVLLGGLVSTLAAAAISAVVLLVFGQAILLLYRNVWSRKPLTSPQRPG